MNKRLTLVSSLCLWLSMASAVNLDSLWGVWNDKAQHDTMRLKAMQEISWEGYLFSQPDSSFYLAGLQLNLAEETGNKHWIASALNTQGATFFLKGNYDEALGYYQRSLEILEEINNIKGMTKAYNNMGIIYKNQGNEKKALEYYHKCLKISEEIGDKKAIAKAYSNIGNIFRGQGNHKQALEYYRKSFKLDEILGDKRGMANTLINIGNIYADSSKGDTALSYYKRALEIYEEISDKRGKAACYGNIGSIFKKQGDPEQALIYYQQGLKIFVETGNRRGMAVSYNHIGNLYFIKEDYSEALKYGNQAMDMATEVGGVLEIGSAAHLLHKVFLINDQPSKALEMYKLYVEMRDSIYSQENKEASIKLDYQHAYEKEQALAEAKHQEQMALSAEREKRQKLIAYATGGGLLIVFLFAIFIFNRLRITRMQKKIIEAQKEIVEAQKKDITDSIQYAENIQQALLPSAEELSLIPDGFVLFKPKDIVSGDFYWMQHFNDRIYIAVCDCTGHGVPGAFMSMIGSSLLDEAVVEKGITKPNEIFYDVRKGFIEALKQTGDAGQQKDGMDGVLIAWDKKITLEIATAFNPAFFIRNGEIWEIKADRQPVGFLTGEQKEFTHHEFTVQRGDTLYLFSDGFHDQFGGPKEKKFMMKNFKNLLLSIQDKIMNEQKVILEDTLLEWKGDLEQVDDILVMGMRF